MRQFWLMIVIVLTLVGAIVAGIGGMKLREDRFKSNSGPAIYMVTSAEPQGLSTGLCSGKVFATPNGLYGTCSVNFFLASGMKKYSVTITLNRGFADANKLSPPIGKIYLDFDKADKLVDVAFAEGDGNDNLHR